jgi:hypothetical protein
MYVNLNRSQETRERQKRGSWDSVIYFDRSVSGTREFFLSLSLIPSDSRRD